MFRTRGEGVNRDELQSMYFSSQFNWRAINGFVVWWLNSFFESVAKWWIGSETNSVLLCWTNLRIIADSMKYVVHMYIGDVIFAFVHSCRYVKHCFLNSWIIKAYSRLIRNINFLNQIANLQEKLYLTKCSQLNYLKLTQLQSIAKSSTFKLFNCASFYR